MLKKILIVLVFSLFLTVTSLVAEHINAIDSFLLVPTVYAADNSSNFQNTSPWFVTWWGKVTNGVSSIIKNGASNMSQWFQSFSQKAINPQQTTPNARAPLTQYPALNNQQSQNQSSGAQQGGQENGTQGSPYKLEPNQFKKICGQNTYILYWRKGGKEGKDMAQPAGGAGAGKDQGAKDYWQLPTCEELAECHCCCNTCKTPESRCQQDGWVFNNKGCPPNCKPTCEGDCKPKCEQWTQPQGPGDSTLNRDCKCNQEGCPKSNAKGCSIVILDPGRSQVEYTKLDGNPEQYFHGTGIAYFKNGNGPADPKSKVIAEPDDKTSNGWVKKLKDQKGVCCKCYQDGPPIQ